MENLNLDTQDKSTKKVDFNLRNILPIPHFLTKTFVSLKEFDPLSVGQAFYSAMLAHDRRNKSTRIEELSTEDDQEDDENEQKTDSSVDKTFDETEPPKTPPLANDDTIENNQENSADTEMVTNAPKVNKITSSDFFPDFAYIIQFCYLCYKKKIPPIAYSVASTPAIDRWFNKISVLQSQTSSIRAKRQNPTLQSSPDSENSLASPDNKISKKDKYFIHAMLKLHDTMDKNYKEKSEKEPGFARLEEHRKNLILNASALPPYKNKAATATEFYSTFLAKKSQFKAKDMLVYQLHSEKIAFNPSSSFTSNLWNCEFFWLLPDTPSGMSIFYCPETKSTNVSDMEKERMLALADKVNVSDVEKLSKQKMYLPNSIMDLIWMTQNLYAVLKLCFGELSHSAVFLKNWADHMYENRLMYTTLFSSDPAFFAKVLYAIDVALQKHWRSCSANEDRLSVNDRVLFMEEVQESILDFSFSRSIPKSISDKVHSLSDNKDKDNNKDGKFAGGAGIGKGKFKGKDGKKEDVLHNTDKSHPNWRIKEGENFSKLFYSHQRECPKTKDGKLICMKFLIKGLCDTSCTRAHSLTGEDAKNFDEFVNWCRSGGQKPVF